MPPMLETIWRLLHTIFMLVQEVIEMVQRVERANEPAGDVLPDLTLLKGLRPATQKIYNRWVNAFMEHAKDRRWELRHPHEFDRALRGFASAQKLSPGQFQATLAAVEKVWPQLKWKLTSSHAALGVMEKVHAVDHTWPMPWPICLIIAQWLAMAGWPRVGALLLLQWSAGLRPSEAVALEGHHLSPPGVGPGGVRRTKAVITLQPKAGTKSRRPQFTMLDGLWTPIGLMILRRFSQTTPRGCRLSAAASTAEYGRLIARACTALHIAIYTGHSPRAGWATTMRLLGMDFVELRELGRWENDRSLRGYLDAVGAMALEDAAPHCHPMAAWLEGDFENRFPWWR